MKLLEAAKHERDKIQAKADKRAQAYATAAQLARDFDKDSRSTNQRNNDQGGDAFIGEPDDGEE